MSRSLLIQASANAIPLRDESVQCVVTSPPYWGLRQYAGEQRQAWGGDAAHPHDWGVEQPALKPGQVPDSKHQHADAVANGQRAGRGSFCECGAWFGALGLEPTPELYVGHMVEVFREVRRVLRRDGTLWLNLGDSYASAPPGNKTQGVSASSRETLSQSVQTKRSTITAGLKPKDLIMIPHRVAIALQADGWWVRMDNVWSKPNPMPESITDRPTKSHEYVFLLTKSERYYYDADAIREPLQGEPHAPGNKAADDWQEIRGAHVGKGMSGHLAEPDRTWGNAAGRNKRSVWTIATKPYAGAHFATYPEELVEPCILAGSAPTACGTCGAPWERVVDVVRGERDDAGRTHSTAEHRLGRSPVPERGWESSRTTTGWAPTCEHDDPSGRSLVLDPFNGSGTTGAVAVRLGRSYVGLDVSHEYLSEQAIYRVDPIAGARKDARAAAAGEIDEAQGVLL